MTATCISRSAGWTVLYHFERHERLCHLRVELGQDERMPAIDDAYPGAFLVENEMSELQLLPVTDLSIDYGGRLYRDFDGPEGWVHDPAPGDAGPVAAGRPAVVDVVVERQAAYQPTGYWDVSDIYAGR